MAIIERAAFIKGLDSPFLYSLSNDFDEIKSAMNEKNGIHIGDIKDSEWTLNEWLAEETKDLMKKHKAVYAATSSVKNDTLHLAINHQISDVYYRYSGRVINGEYFTDIEPVTMELTKEIFDSMVISDILYAEFADSGAMGNSGGVMLYAVQEHQLICYESNTDTNEDVCKKAWSIIEENEISSHKTDKANQKAIFKFYPGGAGNLVFINKDVSLIPIDGCFVYINEGKSYCIYSSVPGVFSRVTYTMQRIAEEKNQQPRRKQQGC